MTRLVERELPFDAVHASLVRLKAHMLRVPDDRFSGRESISIRSQSSRSGKITSRTRYTKL